MNTTRTTLAKLGSKSGTTVLSFAGLIYFSQVVGSSGIGTYFLFQSVVALTGMATELGLDAATEKRLSELEQSSRVFTTGLLLRLVGLFVAATLIVVFQPQLNGYLGTDFAILLVPLLFVREIGRFLIRVLHGEFKVNTASMVQFIKRVCWLLAGVLFTQAGFGVLGLIYALLIANLAVVVLGTYYVTVTLRTPHREEVESLVSFAKYDVLDSVTGSAINWMDTAVLGFFVAPGLIGAYEIAWKISQVVIILGYSVRDVIFPQISSWSAEEDRSQIQSLFNQTITPSLIIVIPALFGGALVSQEILSVVFGESFIAGATVLVVLIGAMIPHTVVLISNKFLQGMDRPELTMRASVITAAINVSMNFLLVWQLGLIGAALATLLSITVNCWLHLRYLSDLIRIKSPYRDIGWLVFSSLVMSLGILAIQSRVSIESVQALLAIILLGVVMYGGTALMSTSIRHRVWQGAKNI